MNQISNRRTLCEKKLEISSFIESPDVTMNKQEERCVAFENKLAIITTAFCN